MTYGRGGYKLFSERDIQEIIGLFRSGECSMIDLAKRFNCDRHRTIRRVLAAHFTPEELFLIGKRVTGKKLVGAGHKSYKPIPDLEVVKEYLLGNTCTDLAAKYSVSADKIERTLRKHLSREEMKANRYRMASKSKLGGTTSLRGTKLSHEKRLAIRRCVPHGDKHWAWRGGISPIDQLFMVSGAWKELSAEAKHRDGYECRRCGAHEHLASHHVIPREMDTAKRLWLDLDNLATVCKKCHRVVEPRKKKYPSLASAVQLKEYYESRGLAVNEDILRQLFLRMADATITPTIHHSLNK